MKIANKSLASTFAIAIAVFALNFSFDAAHAHADCVSNLFSGLVFGPCGGSLRQKPMKLVRLRRDNSYASYMAGVFGKTTSAGTTARAEGNMLYSDRVNGNQPFNFQMAEAYRVDVTTAGVITLTNIAAGTSNTLSAVCSTDMITGSNSGSMYLITYGTAFQPVC